MSSEWVIEGKSELLLEGQILLLYLATFFAAIFVHELGHKAWFHFIKKRPIKIRWGATTLAGKIEDYQDLTDQEYTQVNLWGVLAGGLFILVMSVAVDTGLILLFIPYLVGCRRDLAVIFRELGDE